MPGEVRSGRLIGWIFLVPCSVVTVLTLWQARENPAFLVLTALFGLGALAGASLLFRPPLLLRIHEGHLELYAGCLGPNTLQGRIPLGHIERYKVHAVHDADGVAWILTLHLTTPPSLSDSARARIRLATRSTQLPTGDKLLHWPLSWPAGGATKAGATLRRLLDPHCEGPPHG